MSSLANRIVAHRVARAALIAVSLLASAAQAESPDQIQTQTVPGPDAGAYLAARAADRANDFIAATEWFQRALDGAPSDAGMLDRGLAAMVGLGRFDAAAPLAAHAAQEGIGSQTAHIVLMANAAAAGDWAAVQRQLDTGATVSQMLDDLARGWGDLAQGNEAAAMARFDAMIAEPGTEQFGLYHKALARAVLGDLAGADAILSAAPDNGLPYTRRSIIAHAEILSQMGETGRAEAELARFGTTGDETILALRAALARGDTLPPSIVAGPAEGLGEGFYSVARLLLETAPPAYVLQFARTAQHLHPDDAEYAILTANLLEGLGRFGLAGDVYAAVPATDPAFTVAEFGRADMLRRGGAPEAAVEVLRGMLAVDPGLAMGHAQLADVLRALDRLEEARAAYTDAIALMPETDGRLWRMLFLRGITAERLGDWAGAHDDLRAAYALRPDDPTLLNYLGYSMIERGEDLDEALSLIERAMAGEPDNGAIVDSYGWALYHLGRVQEAVEPMELAVKLDPESAVINDHLGDVYWRVGRLLEAHFQWQRALSFESDPALLDPIRSKLANGLPPEVQDLPGETAQQTN